ncbi:MAG: hypothetical protein IJZ24_06715 [Clostridia bacterium]|nr:hypothetical protein [Clostridia bacterium]
MIRLIPRILIASMLLPCLLLLSACKEKNPPTVPPEKKPPAEEKAPALYIPTPDSFAGQSTEDFSDFVYSEPNLSSLLNAFALAAETILKKSTSYETALETVIAAEALYSEYISMRSYARILYAKDTADTYFSGEYKRLYEATPSVALAVDRLFSAVAASEHAQKLSETKYFPSDITARYQNGGLYTETTTPLFEEECRILMELRALSYDTVTITFNNETDTVTNLLAKMAGIYGKGSPEYQRIELRCQTLYNKTVSQKRADLYVALVGVRRAIADALNYESYVVLMAERLGYTADANEVTKMLANVEASIMPIYSELSASGYFSTDTGKLEKIKFPETMLNTLTHFYEKKGGKLFEGYNYLLHRALFSLNDTSGSKAKSTFSTYLPDTAQSYLYIAAQNSAVDYITVAGALGDTLVHYGNAPVATAFSEHFFSRESQSAYGPALRILTLLGMEEELSKNGGTLEISSYQILLKNEIYSIFRTLLTQSMRAQIEAEVYALKADEISKEALNAIVSRAAERFNCLEMQNGQMTALSLSSDGLLSLEMFESPLSSLTDLAASHIALSLFAMEATAEGTGFSAYEAMLAAGPTAPLSTLLSTMQLQAPTDTEAMRALAAEVYELLTGYSYRVNSPSVTAIKAA